MRLATALPTIVVALILTTACGEPTSSRVTVQLDPASDASGTVRIGDRLCVLSPTGNARCEYKFLFESDSGTIRARAT